MIPPIHPRTTWRIIKTGAIFFELFDKPKSLWQLTLGLGEGRLIKRLFRPSRTTNIFLFNGEANTAQAFAKPNVVGSYL